MGNKAYLSSYISKKKIRVWLGFRYVFLIKSVLFLDRETVYLKNPLKSISYKSKVLL